MMQEVFYHNTQVDITDWVIGQIKAQAATKPATPAAAPATQSATRPNTGRPGLK